MPSALQPPPAPRCSGRIGLRKKDVRNEPTRRQVDQKPIFGKSGSLQACWSVAWLARRGVVRSPAHKTEPNRAKRPTQYLEDLKFKAEWRGTPARRENGNRPALSAVRSFKDVWKKESQHIETAYQGPRGKQSSNTPANNNA